MVLSKRENSTSPLAEDHHRLITHAQLRVLLPVSRMTTWRMEQRGDLPKHFMIGGRAFWRLTEVKAALRQLTNKSV